VTSSERRTTEPGPSPGSFFVLEASACGRSRSLESLRAPSVSEGFAVARYRSAECETIRQSRFDEIADASMEVRGDAQLIGYPWHLALMGNGSQSKEKRNG